MTAEAFQRREDKLTTFDSQTASGRAHPYRAQLIALAAVLLLCVSQVTAMTAQPVRRIHFKPGTTSARLKGRLSGMSDRAVFVIRVRAGQHLAAEVQSKNYAHVTMTSPSGQESDQDMQGTHTGFDSTEAGDYRIVVTESGKADPWKGTFYINVTVL
jgi:hypothetical protein